MLGLILVLYYMVGLLSRMRIRLLLGLQLVFGRLLGLRIVRPPFTI